ncbi:hypothetical protein [Methanospirillum lacunae]|uniref:Uncharacterized protein n=1 Tax=Methanospirillum lacunae TaxID=668570 RepID=A0A2V2N892_9EURY|nr:hypothetical protein [Methanospirillum lacunae]PWR73906.1 hypothetical protein DK846_01700 [Methanospirillum lacunae]
MRDSDYCLSRVTNRKQRIIQGIDASNRAIQVIRVISLAIRNAKNQPVLNLDDLMQNEHIPFTYRSTIIGSHKSPTGKITIPGLFRLLEIISDQVRIITHSVDSDLYESMPGLHEKISRLYSFQVTLKNLDFIFDEERIVCFLGDDYSDADSLLGQINSCKSSFETMRDWFTPCLEYGALCYRLDLVDRFIVRSFMQGVNKVKSGEMYTEYPFALVIRDLDNLIIGYFLDDSPEKMFRIEIQGLSITLSLYSPASPNLMPSAGFLTPFSLLWRMHPSESSSGFDSSAQSSPLLTGSFHARSSDEVMQFLSDIGYQISRYFPDLSLCERIAG